MPRHITLSLVAFVVLPGCFLDDLSGAASTNASAAALEASALRPETIQADGSFAINPTMLKDMSFLKVASPEAKEDILRGLARADNPLTRYGVDATSTQLIHFLAQSATETFGFRTLTESTRYSADRLVEVFPSRITRAKAEAIAGDPRATANHIYGGEWGKNNLGNNPGTDDGWNYRGSGYLQLTGRYNFTEIGDRLGVPIETQPDLVRQPVFGLDAALEYWKWRKVNEVADSGTIRDVRIAINGGINGLSETRVWHAVIKDAYDNRSGFVLEAGDRGIDPVDAAVGAALSELGFLQEPELESTFRSGRFNEALADFQRSRGLEPTGVFDADTLYAITDPDGLYVEE